ncbi:MAG: hypothetical protein LBE76_05665 [Nitrososphaerota archaeon]|jgi:hypothetical protein|nr:hypothetical protein [Nitrososphaerota archaeon]
MYKLLLSEIFACRLDSEAYGFLSTYPRMVNWWLTRGQDSTQTFRDFTALRNQFYNEWKETWKGYNSQHAQTSCLLAFSMLKSKVQNKAETLLLNGSFACVSSALAKVEEEKLVFVTNLQKKAQVTLVPKTSGQCVLLEQAQNKYWQIGQVFLTSKWCNIPFTRYIDPTKENDRPLQELLKHSI